MPKDFFHVVFFCKSCFSSFYIQRCVDDFKSFHTDALCPSCKESKLVLFSVTRLNSHFIYCPNNLLPIPCDIIDKES